MKDVVKLVKKDKTLWFNIIDDITKEEIASISTDYIIERYEVSELLNMKVKKLSSILYDLSVNVHISR